MSGPVSAGRFNIYGDEYAADAMRFPRLDRHSEMRRFLKRLRAGLSGQESGHDPDIQESAIARIRDSVFFDADWYSAGANRAGLDVGPDPARHYLETGAAAGLDPSVLFSSTGYLAANPDVAEARANPLLHYLTHGQAEGRSAPLSAAFRPLAANRSARGSARAHYGPILAARVAAAEATLARPRAAGTEALMAQNFDAAFYLTQNPDVLRAGIDPFEHYLEYGAVDGRDPAPWFSQSAYLERCPEAATSGIDPFLHWLTLGRLRGLPGSGLARLDRLAEALALAPDEAEALLRDRQSDLRDRLVQGAAGQAVVAAAALEPLVMHSWSEALRPRFAPFHSPAMTARLAAQMDLHAAASHARARAVVVVNRPRWGGGARRMEGHLAHALADLYGPAEVLVMTTDASGALAEGKLPDGVRHVDFAALTEGAPPDVRQRLLFDFLRALVPGRVFNVNSQLMWDMLSAYGHALADQTSIHACLFCNEQTDLGFWTGFPVHLVYRHFDVLAGLCPDNHALAEELAERYCLPARDRARIHVLEAPIDPDLPQPAAPPQSEAVADSSAPDAAPARRPQIFWAGRFDRQKRVDLVHALARALPQADIRMWGEAVFDAGATQPEPPANIRLEGVYERFTALPLHEADLWLYTSAWDGVPSLLLEVAMTGIPIVGSEVGGTGEVLRAGESWPIPAEAGEQVWCQAIETVLADPQAARNAAAALRDRLIETRSAAAFAERVAALPEGGPARAPATVPAPATANPDQVQDHDLTLAVTFHSETLLAGPTLKSAEAALAPLEAAGLRVERLIGLDSPSDATRAYLDQPDFAGWRHSEHAFRDQGRTRNALAGAARGRWLAFLDGDDLLSENWLSGAVRMLTDAGPEARLIVHPELHWQFDAVQGVMVNPAQSDRLFLPQYFALANYYDALCVAPRAAWLAHPFADRDIAGGFAFEDWQWGVETMAAGWQHVVARDTVIFKRRRDRSQTHESKSRAAVIRAHPALAIDRLADLGRDSG